MSERSWFVSAFPRFIGVLRGEITAFAAGQGMSGLLLNDLALVVSEALTNAIVHGYREGAEGLIEVRAAVDATGFELHVRDRGRGMQPDRDSAGLGLGLPLIAAVTQEFEVTAHPEGGTALWMRFPLQREGAQSS